jgi:dopamine D2-like receptor
MRHATSWQKNQSGDDAFGRLFETSSTTNTVDTVLPDSYFSATTTKTNHNKFQTKLHHQHHLEGIFLYQKYSSPYQHVFFYLFIFISSSFVNMQHLSNDTSSWNLIAAPPAATLVYNSNTYHSISSSSITSNALNHPFLTISSLVSPQSVTIDTPSNNYWAFILIIFPLFTIFGNILVVISVYREKSLHTVTNYFVVSLAISDITVAAVVMPFAIYLEVSS